MLAWGSRNFPVAAVTDRSVGRGLVLAQGLYAVEATVHSHLVLAALPSPDCGFAFAIVPVANEVKSVLWLLCWLDCGRTEVIHIEACLRFHVTCYMVCSGEEEAMPVHLFVYFLKKGVYDMGTVTSRCSAPIEVETLVDLVKSADAHGDESGARVAFGAKCDCWEHVYFVVSVVVAYVLFGAAVIIDFCPGSVD